MFSITLIAHAKNLQCKKTTMKPMFGNVEMTQLTKYKWGFGRYRCSN